MKIRHLLLALLIAPLSMMAQSKIAVFDSQAIFSVMPEKAAAEARLKTVSNFKPSIGRCRPNSTRNMPTIRP